MGKKHQKTQLDRVRDELMSHVVRCEVLNARMQDRYAWLDDTMEYMRDRHPSLNEMEFARLEMIGRQFIKPAIPHGGGNTARNRPEATVLTADGEEVPESTVTEAPDDPEHADGPGAAMRETAAVEELQPA